MWAIMLVYDPPGDDDERESFVCLRWEGLTFERMLELFRLASEGLSITTGISLRVSQTLGVPRA